MARDQGPRDPIRLGTIDVSAAGGQPKIFLGDLLGDGRMDLLLVQGDDINATYDPHQVASLTAIDLDGTVLWQAGDPYPEGTSHGADFPAQIWDVDGDGDNEVVCVMDDRLTVIDGATGEIQGRHDLPHEDAHDCIVPATLTEGRERSDLIVKDRYERAWALDENFDVLWSHEGNTGHFPWPYDFDGDGLDEVMLGYDFLDADGEVRWSCNHLDEHADCIWVADIDGDGDEEIVVGEGGVYAFEPDGTQIWGNREPREVQHIAPGTFREDEGGGGGGNGLQVAGLDRIDRGRGDSPGKDGIFVVDSEGETICKEDRDPGGWVTIIEPMSDWDDAERDYVLGWRRGNDVNPTLYDGHLDPVVRFPVDGYVVHGDLVGGGREQVLILDDDWTVHVFGDEETDLSPAPERGPLYQPKNLATSTLYIGGQRPRDAEPADARGPGTSADD